jgi:hypothetical protein
MGSAAMSLLIRKSSTQMAPVFCLRYARKWETISANNLTSALAERALKEAALLTKQPSSITTPAKRVSIDDAVTVYPGIHAGYERVPQGVPHERMARPNRQE